MSSFAAKHALKSIDRCRLRNVGIVAHINAGKTTTTERILFHAGSTDTVGDVDRGNTVTDYLKQERDRGITITSAAVSYNYKKKRVNLIDTPGHVDFTVEVERSLSVLDGVVTILDASAGVEAQTITVWNQASRFKLPNVIFLNKYDKPQADYNMCLNDLRQALSVEAALVQLPVKTNKGKFTSIIDVIRREIKVWPDESFDHGASFMTKPIAEANLDLRIQDNLEECREILVNKLCDLDEQLADHVLNCDKIDQTDHNILSDAMSRASNKSLISPVLVGSSYKYIGVQPLMDAILDYLPNPLERQTQVLGILGRSSEELSQSKDGCAFIFKTMHDKRLGPLTYVRVYNGSIAKSQYLKVLGNQKRDQIKKVYRLFADEVRELEEPVGQDDIVALTGITEARTGDILVEQNSGFTNIDTEELETSGGQVENSLPNGIHEQNPFQFLNGKVMIPRLAPMDPVYFCTIEASSSAHQLKLETALACLAREDPSFTYDINELGLITIRGMGKLHLEIVRDRLETEHGVNSLLGPLQISYFETIDGHCLEELEVDKLVNGVKHRIFIKLQIKHKPGIGSWSNKMLRLDTNSENSLSALRNDHRKAIESGFMSAMSNGPSLGFPLIDGDILLMDFRANSRSSSPMISSTASQCLAAAIRRCSPVLLEPIMLVDVITPHQYNGAIISDFASRRGVVLTHQARDNGSMIIRSRTPLANLADYSEFLRVTSSGRATFSMRLYNYTAMSEADKQKLNRI